MTITTDLIQQILERKLMNYNSITNIEQLITAIRSSTYIVGSFGTSGLSFAGFPAIHHFECDARAECNRLAKLHPGKMFLFVELSGAEQVPVQATISI